AATGRPRRVGGFDVVASRYGVRMQGCDCLALTKLDVLGYMDRIPVCVAYEIDGRLTGEFPTSIDALNAARPVYDYLPGFRCDVGGCRSFKELPEAARNYIRYLEQAVGCPVRYVSVGAERGAYFEMD
nr:adenylosuccinate synthetase [Oscillospiraceae bacterium]